MSEMERHSGIIKRLSTKENARDVFDELVKNGEIDPKWCEVEGLYVQYIDSDKYLVVNGCIFNVSDAPREYDSDGSVNEAIKLNDTDYRVNAYFYNGGADFAEILDESIPKADENYARELAGSFPFKETYNFLYNNHKDVLKELEEYLKENV